MTFKIETIKDTIGNNYLGINIYKDMVTPYLEELKYILDDEYEQYTNAQKKRDNNHYHITVINPIEYNKLSKEIGIDKFVYSLEYILNYQFNDVIFKGLGTAEKGDNRAYFIVVGSELLQEVRRKYNLIDQDFHITLGFKFKDVFNVRKNEIIKKIDKFLMILSNEYYKNDENFDFIKNLDNYDSDNDSDVNIIKIENSYATFKNDNNFYSLSLIDDKLSITCKWNSNKFVPILSNTIISRKLNQ